MHIHREANSPPAPACLLALLAALCIAAPGCDRAPPAPTPVAPKPVQLTPREVLEARINAGTDPVLKAFLRQPTEQWHGVYIAGQKSGFASFRRYIGGDDAEPRLVIESRTEFRVEQPVMLKQIEEFEAKPPYRIVYGAVTEDLGDSAITTELARGDDGSFVGVVREGNEQVVQPVADFSYRLQDALAVELWIAGGRNPGDVLTADAFQLGTLTSSKVTYTVAGRHEVLAHGVPVRYYDLDRHDEKQGDIGPERRDTRGVALSTQPQALTELRIEPADAARNMDYAADLFGLGAVVADRKLGDAQSISRLVLDASGPAAAHLRNGPRQQLADVAEGKPRRLVLGSPAPEAGGAEQPTANEAPADAQPAAADVPAEIDAAQAATAEFPSRAPQVVKVLAEAVAGAELPKDKVARITQFVHKRLIDELSMEALDPLSALAAHAGDDAEHAALFVTLARAAGLPARPVYGFVYVDDDRQSFGPHVWAEVFLDGRWSEVDPLWNELAPSGTHLRTGNTLESRRPFLDGLQLHVVDVERILEPGPPDR